MKKAFSSLTLWLLVLAMSLSGILMLGCDAGNPPTDDTPASESNETEPTDDTPAVFTGEYFVSPDGDDANDGSEAHPFATPEQAILAIRALREAGNTDAVTVSILPGEYAVAGLTLTAADGGPDLEHPTVIRGIGDSRDDVVFNAASAIDPALFGSVTDEEMRARFDPAVVDKIVVCDLTAAGFTADQVAKQYAFGSAAQPTDEYKGTNISVFSGNTRLDIARYPNTIHQYEKEAYLMILEADILDRGTEEHGGTLRLPADAAERVAKWKTIDGVWAWGGFMFDWADETTPISAYDPEEGSISFLFHNYGYPTSYREGSYYYLYNAAEELDFPGEYWIDGENMKLYLYPTEADGYDHVSIAVADAPMFTGAFQNLTVENLTMTGARKDFFVSNEQTNGLTVKNCVIRNGGGSVLALKGNNNIIRDCEIFNMGKGGCQFNGAGDPVTLTPGNNLIENNCLHDIGQIQKMYAGGFGMNGVGNLISHNEIYNAPHSVLSSGYENNVIEWNYIHNVAKESEDCGAFYGGGQLHSAGNILRNNKFEDNGCWSVYFDDGLCGWTATKNLLINCAGGIVCGGGRELIVTNNVFIGCGSAVAYDQRMIDWYNMEDRPDLWDPEQNGWWKQLNDYPYQEGIWAESFPNLAKVHFDKTREDDIDFLINPSYSVIENNIYIGETFRWTYNIADAVYQYSTIGYNYSHLEADRVFEPGTYELTKVAQRDKKLVYEPIAYDGYGCYDVTAD